MLARGAASSGREQVVERDGGQDAGRPRLDLFERGARDPLLDLRTDRISEPISKQAQQHLLDSLLPPLLDALLAALFEDLLSGGHDGVLGFGSEITLKQRLQHLGLHV